MDDVTHTSGFTLIELMVVIVLIAITTALVVPEMRGTYEDALLRSTGRKLVSVFHLASSRAIALQQVHRVRLDQQKHRYFLERAAQQGEERRGFVPVREISGCEGPLDERIVIQVHKSGDEPSETTNEAAPAAPESKTQMNDHPEVIAFYPDGTADASEVLLRDRDGFRLALRINGTTARVSLVEQERQ